MRTFWALGISLLAATATAISCGGGTGGSGTTGTGTGTGTGATGGNTGSGASTGTGAGGEGIILSDGGDDGPSCGSAITCASAGADCGSIPDGCGGTLDCGTCSQPKICGGAGTSNVCGEVPCTPKTVADCPSLNIQCGPTSDGCNGIIDCGSCPDPADSCGGGGVPSQCGHAGPCIPKTAADCGAMGFNCGPASDGCGGLVDCGSTCPTGQICGGSGFSGICGAPPCTPRTCAQAGANCGPVSDGCGGLLSCGTCTPPQICGGTQASVCGVSANCTNLCLQQTTCPNPNVTTTITGKVYAPNGTDPLPNALVYVPNGAVQPFPAGVSCDNCGAAASGSPLVSAYSGLDGSFTIQNAPVGANIPLVIQLGRWRRQTTVNVTACTANAVPAAQTRFPRNKSEGDIPLMAFSTGSVDALECVWRKIGIADSEFTGPNGNGRIHIYTGSMSGGASISGAQSETVLAGSAANLNKYDMVLFPCQGTPGSGRTATERSNLLQYVNNGGRVFATHYSYVWLYNNAPLSSSANWTPDRSWISTDPNTGIIDMSFPKGQQFAQWMVNVGASSVLGQIQVNTLRNDFSSVIPPSQLWVSVNDPAYGSIPLHFTFNTPVGVPSTQQCGRVVYSDFHVEDAYAYGNAFPSECVAGAMTPQEKMLEYMLFDLASCVTADQPTCTPKTCNQLGVGCGQSGDGCGQVIDCGTCPSGQTCGGGGVPSQCGTPSCTPKTCGQQNINCGAAGDGCGNAIQCGSCPPGQTCGGGGVPGQCGGGTCTPRTCAQAGVNCGPAGDGCGGLLSCGSCPAGQTCGGGGVPGVCGAPPCTPKTCVQIGAQCGVVADGCGQTIQCGSCPVGQTCNANNQCTIIG